MKCFVAAVLVSSAVAHLDLATPNSLAWNPHDDDLVDVVKTYGKEPNHLTVPKQQHLILKESKQGVKHSKYSHDRLKKAATRAKLTATMLGHYLKGDVGREAGYSTQWNTAKRHSTDSKMKAIESHVETVNAGDRYMADLIGEAQPLPPAPKSDMSNSNLGQAPLDNIDGRLSVLVKGPLRDAVLQAEDMERDANGKKMHAIDDKITSWSSHGHAGDRAPQPQPISNVQADVHIVPHESEAVNNGYMRFLVSRKDQLHLQAKDAMVKASEAEHVGGNSYLRSIVNNDIALEA